MAYPPRTLQALKKKKPSSQNVLTWKNIYNIGRGEKARCRTVYIA